jgi:hypothetical protein
LKNNILVYGAGGIAIRHVQSILDENNVGKIYIYDKKKSALGKMSKFFDDNKNNHKLILCSQQKEIKKKKFFLAFLCTYAFNRVPLIKKIKKLCNIKYFIVEKILESNIVNFKKTKFDTKNIFVNMPLRNISPFKIIKSNIKKKKVYARLHATNWNMICNSLHYINYISYIIKSPVEKISIKKLSKSYKLRRKNFIDFYGEIMTYYKDGSQLQIVSKKNTKKHYFYLEQEKKKFIYNFSDNHLKTENKSLSCKMEYVSQLSNKFYKSLSKYKKVQLPSFNDALNENFLFIQELLKKLKKKSDILKIT